MDEESAAIAVLVTTSTAEEAEKIGRMLVERRLAACANIVSGMRSIFRWGNKISVESECLMIIKTTKQRFTELESAVRQQHNYEVPEIVAPPGCRWIRVLFELGESETDK